MDCGGKNFSGIFGKVTCLDCKALYLIKRIRNWAAPIFYIGEDDRLSITPISTVREYFPRINSTSIEWVDDIDHHGNEIDTIFNPTICMVCHHPLEAILSVRVQKLGFTEYETKETINGIEVDVIKSRPSYRIGRAHSECAMRSPEKYVMVDLRTTPDKRQRSLGNRENDRLLNKWTAVDPSEVTDWE